MDELAVMIEKLGAILAGFVLPRLVGDGELAVNAQRFAARNGVVPNKTAG